MFFENRIKKEYRNEQIVRKKDLDFEISKFLETTIAKSKRSRSFLKLRVTKYYISPQGGNVSHKRVKHKQCTKRKTF